MGPLIGKTIGKIALTLLFGVVSAIGYEVGAYVSKRVRQKIEDKEQQTINESLLED